MIIKAGDNVNRIMTLLQQGQRKLGYGFPPTNPAFQQV